MAFSNLPDDYKTALAEVKMWRERHKQQLTWIGLTDEDISKAYHDAAKAINYMAPCHVDIARAIEAKLKEKNCL